MKIDLADWIALIVIVNALSAVLLPAVALKVKDDVVSEPTASASPVIAPVDVFKDNPAGNEPLCTA